MHRPAKDLVHNCKSDAEYTRLPKGQSVRDRGPQTSPQTSPQCTLTLLESPKTSRHKNGYATRQPAGQLTTRHLGWVSTDPRGRRYRQPLGKFRASPGSGPSQAHKAQCVSQEDCHSMGVQLPHKADQRASCRCE